MGPLQRADTAVLRFARTQGHQPPVERAVRAFSMAGEHAACWLAAGALGVALDAPRRPRWRRALGGIAGAYALNVVVKQIVRRPRPAFDDLPALVGTPTQLSFPSSHAASSLAAARAYAPLVGRGVYPVAVAMAASRVYLGVHYPSDILAGALLGTLVGGLAR